MLDLLSSSITIYKNILEPLNREKQYFSLKILNNAFNIYSEQFLLRWNKNQICNIKSKYFMMFLLLKTETKYRVYILELIQKEQLYLRRIKGTQDSVLHEI